MPRRETFELLRQTDWLLNVLLGGLQYEYKGNLQSSIRHLEVVVVYKDGTEKRLIQDCSDKFRRRFVE